MEITLGCDPELACAIDGAFVDAHLYFQKSGSMGCDGCESIAEIRPGISSSPVDLTAKIWKILEGAYKSCPELDYYSGHYQFGYAIGGHIHFSSDDSTITTMFKNKAGKTHIFPQLIENLDTVFQPLGLILDDKDQEYNRRQCGYGGLSSYRIQSYGFEYRSPGSWLLSPSMTLIALTMAKIVVINTIKHGLNFKELKTGKHNRIFLKKMDSIVKEVPKDCEEGLNQLKVLVDREIDWDVPILQNWGII